MGILVIYLFIQSNLIIIEKKLVFISTKKLFKSIIQQNLSFFDSSDAKYVSEENIYDGILQMKVNIIN